MEKKEISAHELYDNNKIFKLYKTAVLSIDGMCQWVETCTAYISQQNYGTGERPGESIHLSPGYVSRVFKQETGLTLKEYIVKKRMKRAKYLLSTTKNTVNDIAAEAGIWDTRFFSIDWPVKAHIEIPKRWHWGDAQEYQSGRVHFFDYNISEPCISYEVELGTMLAGNPQCVDDPRRLVTYYYHGGGPAGHVHERVWKQISAMDSGRYLYLTKQELCF